MVDFLKHWGQNENVLNTLCMKERKTHEVLESGLGCVPQPTTTTTMPWCQVSGNFLTTWFINIWRHWVRSGHYFTTEVCCIYPQVALHPDTRWRCPSMYHPRMMLRVAPTCLRRLRSRLLWLAALDSWVNWSAFSRRCSSLLPTYRPRLVKEFALWCWHSLWVQRPIGSNVV